MIKAENLTLCYRMSNDRINSIKEYMVAILKRKVKHTNFYALNDVSFEIHKGEVVGIVGNNGAGKSTLLKVIAGILRPTNGKVILNGNVAPMLELGSGFDPDLTGRENIFLNGSILGYSEEFLKSKFDEIVEFSELGDFINVPVRNYSSGMMMRLAFSVASMVSPDILILDEIMAVGDASFQEKSRARMMEMMSCGTTVLLVSHSIEQIRQLCDRVIWLDHGKLMAVGETQEICDQYVAANQRH